MIIISTKLLFRVVQMVNFQLEPNLNRVVSNNGQKIEHQVEYQIPKHLFEMHRKNEKCRYLAVNFKWQCYKLQIVMGEKKRTEKTTFEDGLLAVITWQRSAIWVTGLRYVMCIA